MTPVSSPRSYGTGIRLHRRPCSEPAGAASADRLSFGRCRGRPLTPSFVRDAGMAEKLANIGVILLIFCAGPHFSAKDLFSAGRIAIPGAIVKPRCLGKMLRTVVRRVWPGRSHR